ncbi:MAG: methylated-DNA--[protein]-cysteine S-methyltransferase [Pseudomonadota bacterium]
MKLAYTYMDSPIGRLLLAGTDHALHYLSFPSGHKAFGPAPNWYEDPSPFDAVQDQLTAYFSGERKKFDLRLKPSGTSFQRSVWDYLTTIPYGETRTYGTLARALDRPKASRAVGAANGNNPIPIIIPCHRVIGSTGALTGFGGGMPTKQFLLEFEGVLEPRFTFVLD